MEMYKGVCMIIILVIASILDMRYYKVSNKLILIGLSIGCLMSLHSDGVRGMLYSLVGILLPVVLLFILFCIKVIGAGDIKLLSVVGSMYGAKFVLQCTVMAFLVGGIISLIRIIVQGNLLSRLRHAIAYVEVLMLKKQAIPYEPYSNIHSYDSMHFSIAILLAFMLVQLIRGVMN